MNESDEHERFTLFNWGVLLHAAAAGDLIVLLALVAAIQDLLSLVLAVIILIGLGLLRLQARLPGGRLPGLVVLGLVFADIAAYTATGTWSNVIRGEELRDILLAGLLAAFSSAGLIAAAAGALQRRNFAARSRAAPLVGLAALALLGLALAAGAFAGGRARASGQPSDIVLQTENMAFSATALTAETGTVTVRLANRDLFWHTFTIDELGVDLQVPVGAEQEVAFQAPPGTYEFYCAIPGHALIGMHGTLTVTADSSE